MGDMVSIMVIKVMSIMGKRVMSIMGIRVMSIMVHGDTGDMVSIIGIWVTW